MRAPDRAARDKLPRAATQFRHRVVTVSSLFLRQSGLMVTGAARLTPQLVRALARLDDGSLPIAELARRVARLAEARGLTRPSYERIRQLVHQLRRMRRRPTIALGTGGTASVRMGPFRVRVGSLASLEVKRQRDGPPAAAGATR